MTDTTVADQGQGAPQRSNSPFVQPVPPARVEADAATARQNATVVRPDLADARRIAEQTPQQRYFEQRDGAVQRDTRFDQKLSDADYNKLTVSEKISYAARQTELSKARKSGADRKEGDTPAPDATTETKHKFGDIELTDSEIKGLLERKGLEDSRKATLPADATKYELKLASDFSVPQGIELKFDEHAPEVADLRAYAHKQGWDQQTFSDVLSIHGAMKVRELTSLMQARDAEITELGAAARLRVTAAESFLRGHLGDDLGRAMGTMLVTAKHVEAVEKLMATFRNQGSGSFSPARAPHEPARMSEERWNSMSYGEKKAYAESASSYGNNGRR